MDKYQKLKAVQGLIHGLDEQYYRIDHHPEKHLKTQEVYNDILNKFYNAVLEILKEEKDA